MIPKEQFLKIIWPAFEKRQLDEKQKKRLDDEIQQIDDQDDYSYFLDLFARNVKYPKNENNLIVPYLLGIVDEFDINKESPYTQGDMPDIDVDYIGVVRDYLKNEWAPKTFGADKCCGVGTYNRFNIKRAVTDMARVHGLDVHEVQAITTKLGNKDDEGKSLNWDKAVELYPDLREYCAQHPDVADASSRLINRIFARGKHAGGVVISSIPLSDFLPIAIDTDGNPVSAWPEGLNEQELQPVGLIKFDKLVVKDIERISRCVNTIKKRHNLSSFCALPGLPDWSDESYLNDKDGLKIANEGKTLGIFQFDSSGIRELLRRGGVNHFEDLVAYSSIYRPACLQLGMHDRYIERKHGRENFTIPELIKPITGNTYGVLIYQEQIAKILSVVGNIPLPYCEQIRKAISKKKEKVFAKYKDMFIENGKKNLNYNDEQINEMWDQIVAFSGYGFNKCLHKDSLIYLANGSQITIQNAYDLFKSGKKLSVNSLDKNFKTCKKEIVNVFSNGKQEVFNLVTKSGNNIKATENHRFLTIDGYKKLSELKNGDFIASSRKTLSKERDISVSDVFWDEIKSINACGFDETYDLEVKDTHNYVVDGLITHNSHSSAYSMLSSRLLTIKAHYPIEFFAETLVCEKKDDKDSKIRDYKIDAERHGFKVNRLDLNKSKESFTIIDNELYIGFANCKGVGDEIAQKIVEHQPYTGFVDFIERFGTSTTALKTLIGLRVFNEKDPAFLFEYLIEYKKQVSALDAGIKRNQSSKEKFLEEARQYDPDVTFEKLDGLLEFTIESTVSTKIKNQYFEKFCNACSHLPEDVDKKKYLNVVKKYKRNIAWTPPEITLTFDNFKPKGEIDEELRELITNQTTAEAKYYGFSWNHPLEKCEEFDPSFTFEQFDYNEDLIVSMVQCLVVQPLEKTVSKKGNPLFYLWIEDANWNRKKIMFFENDYNRFKEELEYWDDTAKIGHKLKLRIKRPDFGFKIYSFESWPKHMQWKYMPKEKKDDARLLIMS